MLTDYHVHLRQDDINASADASFTPENIALYSEAATRAGIAELGFAEHMYRFTEALTIWDHPFWKEWALDDVDRYCEVVAAGPARLGIEADFIAGAEDRIANLLDRRPFDYVIGSIHFIGDRSLDTEEFTIWDDRSDPDEIWRRYFETLALAASRPAAFLRAGGRSHRRVRGLRRGLDRGPAKGGGGDLPFGRLHADVR